MKKQSMIGLAAVLLIPALVEASGVGRPPGASRDVGDPKFYPYTCCLNPPLAGQLIDYTCNHGADRRLWSPALGQKRDMYVYLPPRYDRRNQYPLMIYLHGILQDERGFVEHVLQPLDAAMACGELPPMVVVAPDGSLDGSPQMFDPGSFFINSKAGRFQDYVVQDVYTFMMRYYSIRPEREAHILAGVSMGGLGAFNAAIRYRDTFGIVIGIMPVLNLRWMDLSGNYFADFYPNNWGWRNSLCDPYEAVGRFAHGLVKVYVKDVIFPIFGCGPEAVMAASNENPIEMVDRYGLKNDDLDMFIGYAGKDEFNLDAQAESFVYFIEARKIKATVWYDECGRHSADTAKKMIPDVTAWLADRLNARNVAIPKAK